MRQRFVDYFSTGDKNQCHNDGLFLSSKGRRTRDVLFREAEPKAQGLQERKQENRKYHHSPLF